MKKKWQFMIWAAIILLIAAVMVFAVQRFFATSPVTGKLLAVPESASAGETAVITAEMEMPAGCSISNVSLALPEGWIPAGKAAVTDTLAPDLTRRQLVTACAVPLLTGKGGNASMTVHLEDITGSELPAWNATFDLPAAGNVENNTSAPLPLYTAGIMTVADNNKFMSLRFWIFAGAAAAVIILVLVWLKMRRAVPPEKNYWEETMDELEAIKEEIPHCRNLNLLLARLSDTVREYLEKRFSLPALRRTTPEFLSMLAAPDTPLKAEDKEALRTFLAKAELVKFACVNAEQRLLVKATDDAVALVKGTEPEKSEEKEEKKDV